MPDRPISILDGSTFMVSDEVGDVVGDAASEDERPTGLFYRDMRHLSQWRLRLNGRGLRALHAQTPAFDEAVFHLVEPGRHPSLSLRRQRWLIDGMREEIELCNHGLTEVEVELSVRFGADFADIFEVKERLPKIGRCYRRGTEGGVTLGYLRDDFRRETRISAPTTDVAAAHFTEGSLTFQISLRPGARWRTTIVVTVGTDLAAPNSRSGHDPARAHRRAARATSLAGWLAAAPRLESDWSDLGQIYRRSLVDLAGLRFNPNTEAGTDADQSISVPAAGLPWYLALFGRDALIASYQSLPFTPELARSTLLALGQRQARELDDFRDAEPGKILHELRLGELVHFGQRPHSPYYGSADATPLFLIVLDEYERWSSDIETVNRLAPAARAAIEWLRHYGDCDGDGFIEYERRNQRTGLANQCWKDSPSSIVYPDGRLASLPRATCELQGYAYDARIRTARLARQVWGDPGLADQLEAEAAALKAQFDRRYWLEDLGWYALALDGQKRPVPTLTSNIGHLLWSGIVERERVERLVTVLMGESMFTGWGLRTLAEGQLAYNPVAYHNGAVWPHDTALAAAGLARYGRHREANELAMALLTAATHFAYRLPEVFAGFARVPGQAPVEYPTACSPQAWASGAPLLLIRIMLGLVPTEAGCGTGRFLPDGINRLSLDGWPVESY